MSNKTYLKFFIVFCIVVFIIANGIFIYIYFKNKNSQLPTSYTITEYSDGVKNEKTIKGNVITSVTEYSLVNENIQVWALSNSEFELQESSIKLNKGTILLSAQNYTLELQGAKYLLANKYRIIMDAEDGVITVEGDAAFNNKILDLNTQLLFVGSDIEQYQFERDDLSTKDKYKNLKDFVSEYGSLPEFFNDLTPPELISISPRDNFITQERFVRLFGYTEVNSKIVFDDETLVADSDGYFTKQIDLVEGGNIVSFTLKDNYGNTKLITINYTRKKTNIPVASYPVSAPVSYPN